MNEMMQFLLKKEAAKRSSAADLPLDRERPSGFALHPIDREATLQMLDSFLHDSEPEEDRATLALLRQAINEHRAAVGARLMFLDE